MADDGSKTILFEGHGTSLSTNGAPNRSGQRFGAGGFVYVGGEKTHGDASVRAVVAASVNGATPLTPRSGIGEPSALPQINQLTTGSELVSVAASAKVGEVSAAVAEIRSQMHTLGVTTAGPVDVRQHRAELGIGGHSGQMNDLLKTRGAPGLSGNISVTDQTVNVPGVPFDLKTHGVGAGISFQGKDTGVSFDVTRETGNGLPQGLNHNTKASLNVFTRF